MASELNKIIPEFSTTLSADISAGATSLTLASTTAINGSTIPDGRYGFRIGGDNTEYVVGDLVGGTLSNIKTIDVVTRAETSGTRYSHSKGDAIALTNYPALQKIQDLLEGNTDLDGSTPLKYDANPTLTQDTELATKKYVDDNGGVTDHGALAGLGDDDHTQYHNDARADAWLATKNTDDVSEGATNLYYTDARVSANSSVSANTSHRGDTTNPHSVSASQVGNTTAQWNADKLQGRDIATTAPTDGQNLTWNASTSKWEPQTPAGTGDMLQSTYDPAGVNEQLVGETATQTLTNKTLTEPTITLKQGTAPTPTAEGDIQWDTDNDKIVIGNGAGQKTFSDDTYTLNRANHTGTQTASTISDFQATVSVNTNVSANTTHRTSTSNPHSTTVSNLADTTISSVSDGDVLTYDNATGKWINSAPSGGGNVTLLASSTSDKNLNVTTSEQTVWSYTLAGGTISAGDIIEIDIIGWINGNIMDGTNGQIFVKIGTVGWLLFKGSIYYGPKTYMINIKARFQFPSASQIRGQGFMLATHTNGTEDPTTLGGTWSSYTWQTDTATTDQVHHMADRQTTTLDTTTDQTISMTVKGQVSATNGISVKNYTIKHIKK